ncbi:putative methyltransferase NSUN7 [Hippocampus comes]|uniref:putative methyltransferase NSUN7 n=1 Tax=Hippocampus comes TaxID=109280 RepID=UPI00094EE516|nr:PREDICTED: putative methyltransferase NSUN7 [Hippocampus comes]
MSEQKETPVTKANSGRCHIVSKWKTNEPISQHEGETDLQSGASQVPLNLVSTSQGHAAFPDSVYLLASVIFQNSHQEKPAGRQLVRYGEGKELPLPQVEDEMLRPAYELAFNTLIYQELLEDVITDGGSFISHPIPDDQMSLFAVMLYDLKDRKFFPQDPTRKESIREVRDVENYLIRFKTKLEASLARYRIKHDLSSLDCILPESVKVKQERSNRLPLYAWVNTLRSSLDEVQNVLMDAGLSQVNSIRQLEGQTFCQDADCEDLLVFPTQMKERLDSTKLLHNLKLVMQDKSCSLAPKVAISFLPDDGDVLLVGTFSGLTVSHTASLIKEKHKASDNKSRVLACVSGLTDAQREAMQQVIIHMGCKNVKLINEVFQSLTSGDKRLAKVRLILLTPNCSLSAVSNPLEFMLQENRDASLLQDFSQGSLAQSKLEALIAQQREDIDHALKFPQVLAVVYATCSSHPEENEEVVTRAIEQANVMPQQDWRLQKNELRQSQALYNPPDRAEGHERQSENNSFFRVEPSELSNGCFMAVLIREMKVKSSQYKHGAKETSQAVQAKVSADCKPERVRPNQPTRKKQRGQNIRPTKVTFAKLPKHQISEKMPQVPRGTPPKPRLQTSQNCISDTHCNREKSSSGIPTPEKNSKAHIISPVFNTVTSTPLLCPAPPLVRPATSAVRPRRIHQLVLKPAVIVLRPQHLPQPPHPHPRLHAWRTLAPTFPSS